MRMPKISISIVIGKHMDNYLQEILLEFSFLNDKRVGHHKHRLLNKEISSYSAAIVAANARIQLL